MAAQAEVQWLVAGLGNPGQEYAETRHNVGFAVLDRLAADAGVPFRPGAFLSHVAWVEMPGGRTLLLKPQAFMNRSGPSVAAWRAELEMALDRLVLVHDDLDLPLGRLRIVREAGAGGHKGVASVQEALGGQGFPRIRVGIGRPAEGEAAVDRVLAAFQADERRAAIEVLERAAAAVRTLIAEGLAAAMNRYNVWAPRTAGPDATGAGGGPEPSDGRR